MKNRILIQIHKHGIPPHTHKSSIVLKLYARSKIPCYFTVSLLFIQTTNLINREANFKIHNHIIRKGKLIRVEAYKAVFFFKL